MTGIILSDADCGGGTMGVQTPSPYGEGATLHCIKTSAGGWCMAGSGAECNAPGDCPEGEICTFMTSDKQDGSGSNVCMAQYATQGNVYNYGIRCK